MQSERNWSEHFTWHIRQVPFQLAHMRDLAETTVGAQAAGAGKISGTKDRNSLPYRVDPADDADHLYLRLLRFGQQVAETIGGASPRPLRAQLWSGDGDPLGLPVCTPSEAFALAAEIIRWLEACTHQIAHHGTLTQEGSPTTNSSPPSARSGTGTPGLNPSTRPTGPDPAPHVASAPSCPSGVPTASPAPSATTAGKPGREDQMHASLCRAAPSRNAQTPQEPYLRAPYTFEPIEATSRGDHHLELPLLISP